MATDVFHAAADECRESYIKASRFWTLVFWGAAVAFVAVAFVYWWATGGAR